MSNGIELQNEYTCGFPKWRLGNIPFGVWIQLFAKKVYLVFNISV